jgi:hypothetical protein
MMCQEARPNNHQSASCKSKTKYLTYDTLRVQASNDKDVFQSPEKLRETYRRETHHPSPLTAGIKYEYEYLKKGWGSLGVGYRTRIIVVLDLSDGVVEVSPGGNLFVLG